MRYFNGCSKCVLAGEGLCSISCREELSKERSVYLKKVYDKVWAMMREPGTIFTVFSEESSLSSDVRKEYRREFNSFADMILHFVEIRANLHLDGLKGNKLISMDHAPDRSLIFTHHTIGMRNDEHRFRTFMQPACVEGSTGDHDEIFGMLMRLEIFKYLCVLNGYYDAPVDTVIRMKIRMTEYMAGK